MPPDPFHHLVAADVLNPTQKPRAGLGAFWRRLAAVLERAAQRRMLAELTDDQLRDIGLSRNEADREAKARFRWP
jgi:uncharacterized protein YjiS (DUF1127 family)